MNIILSANKTRFIIKTQQLITNGIDGEIEVDNIESYDKMNAAMNKFNMQLFRKEHKSYYSEIDIQMLNGNRTIPPAGLLKARGKASGKLIELDISKAYTGEFKYIYIYTKYLTFKFLTSRQNTIIQNLRIAPYM